MSIGFCAGFCGNFGSIARACAGPRGSGNVKCRAGDDVHGNVGGTDGARVDSNVGVTVRAGVCGNIGGTTWTRVVAMSVVLQGPNTRHCQGYCRGMRL